MTVMAFCDQCTYHRAAHSEQPVMGEHDNPGTGQHCPGSGRLALVGVPA